MWYSFTTARRERIGDVCASRRATIQISHIQYGERYDTAICFGSTSWFTQHFRFFLGMSHVVDARAICDTEVFGDQAERRRKVWEVVLMFDHVRWDSYHGHDRKYKY